LPVSPSNGKHYSLRALCVSVVNKSFSNNDH
jgi:hypothetical protein